MVATTLTAPSGIAVASGGGGHSQRRLKKLGFKQLLSIQRGSSGNGLSLLGATEAAIENEDQQDRGLGVDASEVTEHHLQAALSSTQLASDGVNGNKSSGSSRPAYHIPTPEAKAVLTSNEYSTLYPSGAYSDPVTYVRSSDTVEQLCRGPSYCMDEDDNDWLEERNKKAAEAIAAALKNAKSPLAASKGKNKERTREELVAGLARDDVNLRVIRCEEYEMIITVFEQVTSDKVPFAHLDVTKLPSLDLLLPAFDADGQLSELALPELPELPWEHHGSSSSKHGQQNGTLTSRDQWSPSNPYHNLSALKPIAPVVYPWWKERREEREGKTLVPALNFDESNEMDPYVCFRRREVKTIRKTRKTDVLHLEKLVKLRHEFQQAVTLMALMAHREKTKRATLLQDRMCWQAVCDFIEVKRRWNIQGPNGGVEDEDLVSGDKREDFLHGVAGASKRKRRLEEGAATAAGSTTTAVNGAAKAPSKKPRPSGEEGVSLTGQSTSSNANSSSSIGLGSAISDRVQAVQAYIERECQRKADGDVGWEEGSDAAFQPMLVPPHLRNFRPIHADADSSHQGSWSHSSPSNAGSSLPRAGRPASFRRRLGRGGRIFLDRRLPAPSPVPASLSDWPRPDPTGGRNRQEQSSTAETNGVARFNQEASPSTEQQERGVGKKSRPWQGIAQAPLTGPFAFSPSIRPSLLHAASPMIHVHTSDAMARSEQEQAEAEQPDASSPTSSSTLQSKGSNGTTNERATSTQPTDVDEMEEETEGSKEIVEEGEQADEGSDGESDWEGEQERWTRLQERWRYDDEGGRWAGLGLCGLGGMEDDDEAIVDDFDQRFMRFRMTLLEEADLLKLSTDLANVMQAQAAADVPLSQPAGYAIFRGENPSMFHQQQAQQQQVQQQQQRQQAQAQAAAAAAAASAATTVSSGIGQGGSHPQAPNAMTMPNNNLIARAAQTNVGGPLTALQQQQQLHQAQLQMALHQQQQRAAAAAAQAQASALATNQHQQSQGSSGGASPISRPRSSQQIGMPHPLSQSFSGVGTPQNMPGSASPMGSSNSRFGLANGQNGISPSPYPNGMMTNANSMSSPQLQAHLAAARPPSSSSPVSQQRSSPHLQNSASFHSSPAQKHATPMGTGPSQQQRPASGNGNYVGNGNGAMPQMNPLAAAAALQQAQAVLQAQQQQNAMQQGAGGGGGTNQQSAQFSSQLMAMHAALTQNQGQSGQSPMQLKLPANRSRALEMAQQAAKLAAAAQQRQGSHSSSSTPTATSNLPGNSGGVPPSQAQLGMGLLQNLQHQMAQSQQQHGFSSPGPNSGNTIMAGGGSNNNSPKTKSRS